MSYPTKKIRHFRLLRFLWATIAARIALYKEIRAYRQGSAILASLRQAGNTDATGLTHQQTLMAKREELRRIRYRLELDQALSAAAAREID